MIRIAICDDEIFYLKKIQATVMKEFKTHNVECNYFQYTSAKDFIADQKKQPFDVAFLDIIMPEYTGFQAAAEVRALQSQTYIIFITSNDESVYDAFDFQPFQFIRKDCDDIFENRMQHVITSLIRHLKQNKTFVFHLPFSEEKKVKISDIVAVKSDRNYLEIHSCKASVLRVRSKLSEIEEELLAYDFVRVHNRWLINMRHIRLPDYPNEEVIMINDLTVPLSRRNKNELQKKYAEYLRSMQ